MSVTKVDKPWGHELRFARTDRYAGKVLFIKAGSQLSLQYHETKDEAFYVQEGVLDLVLGEEQRVERLEAFAAERGVGLLDVAIGGLAAVSGVASVIAGATKPEQVRANAAAGRWQPTADDLAALRAAL